ncbi:3-ketoacyl-CoA thiolase @ Acetyl-CoA acetyltransferase [hydrothermal vent metagenome]|uniref:3-ketoacyl-CoA thiolase @ Acetyl-CoA acetyltransferase n=2 Tax=hydrothermal vent metagenome TaxID=652676 RepID=A0A3B0S3T8_9ZZZZ
MTDAVIVDAVRTPGGRRGGQLKDWHPVDLLSEVLRALAERNTLDTSQIDDVIVGCVSQLGEQAMNVGRSAVLAADFPETVPATTVDRQCGSSQQAAHFAAQGVIAGAYDIVIAAGVESMTRVPMGSSMEGPGKPFGPRVFDRYDHRLVPQGISAELIAQQWDISREEIDALAYESHFRANRATEEGRFENEIIPIEVRRDDGTIEMVTRDEGIRPSTTLEGLAGLRAVFKDDGIVTAGNSSQICDGAAAVLIMSAEKAQELGLKPRARFHTFALAGTDPVTMLTGPIPATQKALAKAGMTIDDIDIFEVNEAFATVIAAWQRETGADLEKTNVNGGAMALGHPLGASGAKLMTTLLNELERTGGRYGLQTMCEGGGLANATIIERLD